MNASANGTSSQQREPRFPMTFSTSSVTQVLAAFACYLGAFVLPHNYPELGDVTRVILVIAGTVSLVLGIGNILLGRFVARLFVKFGMRSRVVIPREGMVYLGIMLMLAIGALLGHQNTLLLVFGLMAGPFVLNGWAVYTMLKGVTVERSVQRRASAAEFVTVDIRVKNGKRWLASCLLEVRDLVTGDAIKRERRHFEGVVTFVRVPGRGERTGRYQLRFERRGGYRLGPLRVSSRFPLGIGERGHTFNDHDELLVWPRLGRLTSEWTQLQRQLAESGQQRQSKVGLFDDEFHRIREYRVDDNPRAIHWRSTARRGELMVREFEQTRKSDMFVLLDLHTPRGADASDLETAISMAATICVDQARAATGVRYLLAIAGEKLDIVTGRVAGPFRESALDTLAVCTASARADLNALVRSVVESGAVSAGRGVLITPRSDYARLIVPGISAELLPDGADLLSRLSIVEATESELQRVFELPNAVAALVSQAGKVGQAASDNGSVATNRRHPTLQEGALHET